jgi:hypothetical protein
MAAARHLAQLNIGRLVAPTDDPRVAEFMGALDKVNGIGKRSKGFVWMMEGSGEPGTGNTENSIGDDPQFVANLTVWESLADLEHFVWNTIHRQFYQRRRSGSRRWAASISSCGGSSRPSPDLDEALERLEHLKANGASEHAFDWVYAGDVYGFGRVGQAGQGRES